MNLLKPGSDDTTARLQLVLSNIYITSDLQFLFEIENMHVSVQHFRIFKIENINVIFELSSSSPMNAVLFFVIELYRSYYSGCDMT